MTQTAPSTTCSPQIKHILGNEGCERFSFYEMTNVLTFFMIDDMLIREHVANANDHVFVSTCYSRSSGDSCPTAF
jgi:POT family proton-dependent oligopeptide transporter